MQTSRDGWTVGLLPDMTADGVEFIPKRAAVVEPWIAEFVFCFPDHWRYSLALDGWEGDRVGTIEPGWYYYRSAPPKPDAAR